MTAARPLEHPDVARAPLRGICLVVKGGRQALDVRQPPRVSAGATARFPRRPDAGVLSESIPLFFIGRNTSGFWIAREAEARTGGMFLLKRSALRFARRNSAPIGCATMFLADRFELDVENHGNPLAAWLEKTLRRAARLIPDHPPPIPTGRRIFKGERP
jgi:hypothetical protein